MSAPKFGDDIALGHLASIDASLKRLVELSERRLARTAAHSQGRAENSATVASDSDLDSQYGDPKVTFDPKDWTGPRQKGRKFSECPSAFLDMLAEVYDYFASKETDENKVRYKRLDASRARGWSLRNRNKPEQTVDENDGFGRPEPF